MKFLLQSAKLRQNSTLFVLKNEIYRPINQKCTLLDGHHQEFLLKISCVY